MGFTARLKTKILIFLMTILTFYLTSQEASETDFNEYYDFLTLWRAYPDLPGLTELLVQIELRIGIRKDSEDPFIIEQSQMLYEEANSIIQNNEKTDHDVLIALDLLNQSLSLNPENLQASELKDSINQSKGSSLTIILPSGLRSIFERAMEEYMAGDLYKSYITIRNLSNDERMMKYPDYLKLKEIVYNEYYRSLKGL